MTSYFGRLIAAGAIVLGVTSSVAMAQPGYLDPIQVPQVPTDLEVPDGYSVFYKGHAVGTQNFICMPNGTGGVWTFLGPQATLFQTLNGDYDQQVATHFLSANPDANGAASPSWQHSFDSSQVWGKMKYSSSDPNYVEPGAIAWLLLDVVGAERGPEGGSLLAQAKYIHRLNTSGGTLAAKDCATIGALNLVPYTADYFFYRADPRR